MGTTSRPTGGQATGEAASRLIDQRIADLGDWRGKTLARMRALILAAEPAMTEEWKWMGTPVWSHHGIVCTGETYQQVVKLTFAHGASLTDPKGLFNASLEGNTRRAIDIRDAAPVDARAFKALVKAAVARNVAALDAKAKPKARPRTETTRAPTEPTYFDSAAAFAAWLDEHAATADELLVGFHKVGSGRPSMSWPESVDEALCHGWIDGVRKRVDDERYQIRFTPRQAASTWSAVNIAKVAQLQAQGRMRPAGERAFALRTAAKSVIYAYEQPDSASLSPAELAAFRQQAAAWAFFEATPPGYRKVMLHWVTTAKKAETRASRFARLLDACRAGERLR